MLAGLVARIRSLWRSLTRRSDVESEVDEEFRHHIDLRTRDLIAEGLPPREARRRAHLEFGHREAHRETARASRGLRPFDRIRFSWIDVKLGLRMLLKYPGLTLVALFALGIGIPVGLAPMHLSRAVEAPLPEDPDNRVRAIRYWDAVTTSVADPTHFDLELLRRELTTFDQLAGFRAATYNVASEEGRAAPVPTAEVTASTFDILGTQPLLGRALRADDERLGAAAVIVLGHDLWRARFAADLDVVGRTVRVGQTPHTVVGVMPPGFLFPSGHQAWLPIRDVPASEPGEGRRLLIIGRLAEGASVDDAQAEVAAVGLRVREDVPEARARLQPEVVPFGLQFMGIPRNGLEGMPEFYLFQLLALVLLLVACGNVAMLVFARTATRFRELAVRTALGASRKRIVSQMFAETLVLAVLAAGVGLISIDWILGRVRIAMLVGEVALPYWLTLRVTPESVVWAIVLAALSATVAGVVPALRITGKKVQENIRRAEAGRSGIKFGGATSAVVVADVAVAVTVVVLAFALSERLTDVTLADELTGIPAEEFLAVELRLPVERTQENGSVDLVRFRERLAATQQAVVERLEAEPGVRGVAVAQVLPRMDHPSRRIEVEGVELGSGTSVGRYVRTAVVSPDLFEALDRPVLSGRTFSAADPSTDAPPVIVNTGFADRLLGGRDPVGRRLRFVGGAGRPAGPWQEIVGVVGHLGVNLVNPQGGVAVYVPAAPGEIYPVQLGIHVGQEPEAMAPRVREIVAETDPDAILGSPVVLSEVHQGDWYLTTAVAGGLLLLVVILVTLAASAVYAIMSYSVSERTREIGIRTALGASRSRVVYTILKRSVTQVTLGAALGIPLATALLGDFRSPPGETGSTLSALPVALAAGIGIVSLVALFSCVAPTRRALRIEASEALRGVD